MRKRDERKGMELDAALRRRRWMPAMTSPSRTQTILGASLGGGRFYGHPAAFAVYQSASVRWGRFARRTEPRDGGRVVRKAAGRLRAR